MFVDFRRRARSNAAAAAAAWPECLYLHLQVVMFIGDGVNDSPALVRGWPLLAALSHHAQAKADVGVAIG